MTKQLKIALLLLVTLSLMPLSALALLQKGETLPEVAGETIDGKHFSLGSLKGKPILLKIGTTWCGTCSTQSKAIDEIRDYISANDITFVEVFIQENAKKVRKYFDKKGLQLPDQIILDDGDIAKRLNIYVIPRLLLIDKNFQVNRDGNDLSSGNLKKKLQQMLSKS